MKNIFQTREAMRKFAEISQKLPKRSRKDFTFIVKELADRKVTSQEGEFKEFKVTLDDLLELSKQVSI